ncbi:MAG: LamB/YcsF family protein [Candidatus Viridilinea halotolerans]|uniref:5-oxoprolinase subunit A n=1 Tax=Candidatus Viridilinea halotolerans TaxID=2491704 RepID=A0A426TZC2_9CHLR|nr:MAG: LamB/YcsF family protein [Candidatus Viridilinea halotolerans]
MPIDLNCDCGEGFGPWPLGDDAALLPHVTSANIACGGHAGDPDTMRRTVRLAHELGVKIGAHPGYPDLLGFGRRVLPLRPAELTNSLLAQLGALAALVRAEQATLHHVKPHGALYNQAAIDAIVAQALVEAVVSFDRQLVLVALANSVLEEVGRAAGLVVAREAFADRAYESDGTLRPRHLAGALILDHAQNLAQTLMIVREQQVRAYDGTLVPLHAETICLHGDMPGAAARAAFLRRELVGQGVLLFK